METVQDQQWQRSMKQESRDLSRGRFKRTGASRHGTQRRTPSRQWDSITAMNSGAGEGNRTRDLRITSAPLYQLSYAGPQNLHNRNVISSSQVCQRAGTELPRGGAPMRLADSRRRGRKAPSAGPGPRHRRDAAVIPLLSGNSLTCLA